MAVVLMRAMRMVRLRVVGPRVLLTNNKPPTTKDKVSTHLGVLAVLTTRRLLPTGRYPRPSPDLRRHLSMALRTSLKFLQPSATSSNGSSPHFRTMNLRRLLLEVPPLGALLTPLTLMPLLDQLDLGLIRLIPSSLPSPLAHPPRSRMIRRPTLSERPNLSPPWIILTGALLSGSTEGFVSKNRSAQVPMAGKKVVRNVASAWKIS